MMVNLAEGKTMRHNKRVMLAKNKWDMVRASYYLALHFKRMGIWAYEQASNGKAVDFRLA